MAGRRQNNKAGGISVVIRILTCNSHFSLVLSGPTAIYTAIILILDVRQIAGLPFSPAGLFLLIFLSWLFPRSPLLFSVPRQTRLFQLRSRFFSSLNALRFYTTVTVHVGWAGYLLAPDFVLVRWGFDHTPLDTPCFIRICRALHSHTGEWGASEFLSPWPAGCCIMVKLKGSELRI